MKERSIMSISNIAEIVSMLVILSVFIMSSFVLLNQIEEVTDNALKNTVIAVESSINLYLQERQRDFFNVVGLIENGATKLTSITSQNLNDVYKINKNLQIEHIFIRSEASRIFENYTFSHSAAASFFESALKSEWSISPMLSSPENDSISIYYTVKRGEGLIVARIDLDSIQQLLENISVAYDRIVLISSESGYVLASSNPDLPLKIVPKTDTLYSILNEPYVLTKFESQVIQNNIVSLTPKRLVTSGQDTIKVTISLIALLIIISFVFKSVLIKKFIIKPLKQMLTQINDFDMIGTKNIASALMSSTQEANELHQAFVQKAGEIETQYREIDKERQMAVTKLIEAEKLNALGSLVAGVAHEVNTPIGNCITSVSYLQLEHRNVLDAFNNGSLGKNTLYEYLKEENDVFEIVESSLQRASSLITNFKLLAVEQSTEEISQFDLKSQIESVVSVLKHQLKVGHHTVEIICKERIILTTRTTFIHQIFTNLIMNSIIHGFSQIDDGMILIEIKKVNNTVIVDYKDNGTGIPVDISKRIYEPFFTTKRGEGGSGLGMSIINNILTSGLNGTISLQKDTPNAKGVHFIIEFPLTIH